MNLRYTPSNWYWVVAGSTTQVYSSAASDYVPVADATYVAWLAAGNRPSTIASETELGEVLARYDLTPVSIGILDSYQDKVADEIPTRLLLKVLFNLSNRVRVLEGDVELTKAQFKLALKAMVD